MKSQRRACRNLGCGMSAQVEPVALAVHLEDANVVGDTVQLDVRERL